MSMNVFFQSFVGRDYTTGGIFGKRIMVLGESHYCDEGCTDCGNIANHRECMAFTNGVVSDFLNEDKPRERWMSTFLKFERSLVGHETEWPERQRIWQSVLFYNYLQVAMGGPRKAGTEAEYRQAEEAFFSVLDQYRPQYIIAWGNRLWGEMPGGERLQNSRTSIFDLNIRWLPLNEKDEGNTLETRGLTYSYTFLTKPKNAHRECKGTKLI